jgi:recombination protein RecR
MGYSVASLEALIDQFAKLPTIGRKTAQKLAYHILNLPMEDCEKFASAILDAKNKIKYCKKCQNFTDGDYCKICENPTRDQSTICVVEEPRDILALERTHEYEGVYHVLHGAISPLNGVSPEDIKIAELLNRIKEDDIKEVIMATNASVEGEATAMYISHILKPLNIKCTRLAYGLPVGSDLEYADEVTLGRALEGRSEM